MPPRAAGAFSWARRGRERSEKAPAACGGTSADRKALARLGMAEEDMAELAKRGQPFNAMPIRAPVSGYVAKRSALAGLYVQPGSELFQIADLSTVWVVADVYEQDVGRIQVGERARISLAAYPGESFTGAVQFIYPALNQESRTLQARIELKNPALR